MSDETAEKPEEFNDFRKPWDIRPDEPPESFRHFVAFRELPPERRSITKAHNAYTGKEATSNTISAAWRMEYRQFDWENRAASYDIHKYKERERIVSEINSDVTNEIGQHTITLRKLEIACGIKALQRAQQIMALPLVTEEVKELQEGRTIIYKQEAISPALYLAATSLMEKGSKIARKGLGIRDEDSSAPISIEEYKNVMYRNVSSVEPKAPAGAMQPIPTQTAVKPSFHTEGIAGVNGNGNAQSATAVVALKGQRMRP